MVARPFLLFFSLHYVKVTELEMTLFYMMLNDESTLCCGVNVGEGGGGNEGPN